MVEFLIKFESSCIKIARVCSILITKSIDFQLFTLILYGIWGPLWSRAIFRAQSIYRKVYGLTNATTDKLSTDMPQHLWWIKIIYGECPPASVLNEDIWPYASENTNI